MQDENNANKRPFPERCLFISGWAGFSFLFPFLSGRTRFIVPAGPDLEAEICSLMEQQWDIVIAWSLGAHLCLKNIRKVRAERLLLMAPFLDFCRDSSRSKVQEMVSGLDKNPSATVRWFWRLCGVKDIPEPDIRDSPGLLSGLDYLCRSKVDPGTMATDLPVILIHGKRDRIVPFRVSEEIAEYLSQACYVPLPYGHFIPEEEIIRFIYE